MPLKRKRKGKQGRLKRKSNKRRTDCQRKKEAINRNKARKD